MNTAATSNFSSPVPQSGASHNRWVASAAALAATLALAFGVSAPAAASDHVSVSINTPDFGVRLGSRPYYRPAPVVVAQPVYAAPPVYVPRPVVYSPAPVYVQPAAPNYYYRVAQPVPPGWYRKEWREGYRERAWEDHGPGKHGRGHGWGHR